MDVAFESQPRPMPEAVARAYCDPMPLRELLASSVYSDADRAKVRDELLEALISQHGNVEVFVRGKEQLVSTRAKSMRKVADAIEFVLGVEGFGGERETLPVLARVMQRRWGAWWDTFEWRDWKSVSAWRDVSLSVLGDQQFRWLGAQYARSILNLVRPQDRAVCLAAIKAAERYAIEPTKQRLAAMRRARAIAYSLVYDAANAAAAAAAYAAAYDAAAAAAASAVAAYAYADAYITASAAYQRLANLTRHLISPQLIASESSGMRASPR